MRKDGIVIKLNLVDACVCQQRMSRMNATIMTVAKLAAAEQLNYASEKEMPCPMKI
jgi:hypothetical protein